MNKALRLIFILLFLNVFSVFSVRALDFWNYPEIAEKHSLFAGSFLSSFTMPESFDFDKVMDYFSFNKPEIFLDYMLPVGLPFSFGVSVNVFDPGIRSYGIRPGYHINFGDKHTDIYLLYTVDIVSEQAESPESGEYLYLEFGGRIGVRRRFGKIFCLTIESGSKFESIHFGISLKCN